MKISENIVDELFVHFKNTCNGWFKGKVRTIMSERVDNTQRYFKQFHAFCRIV